MSMEYEAMRQFADTWGLVFLVAIFVFVVVWIFRPGSSKLYDEQAKIPFNDDGED